MVKEKILVKKRTTTVALAGSALKSVRFVSTEKTGYRVIENDKIGVFGAVGKFDEAEAWKRAEANLVNDIPYPCTPEKNAIRHEDVTPKLLSDKQFVSEIEKFLAKLKENCPQFIFSNSIKKVEIFEGIENDQGVNLSFKTGYYIVSLIVKEQFSANVFDLGYSYVGREFNVEKMVEEVKKLYSAYYIPSDIETGERLVIGGVFDFGFEKVCSDISANAYCNGSGLFTGKVGQQVFNESLTVYEDRNPETAYSTKFFDDEGVIPKDGKTYLFDGGVFVAPLACKLDAAKYSLKKAGCAGSAYDGVPRTSISNICVAGSGKTLKELTAGEEAILLIMASGGDTTADGNFATPVQVAYLVRGGELVGRLPAINMSGNLFDIFGKNFVGRAEDSLLLCDGDGDKPIVVRMTISK